MFLAPTSASHVSSLLIGGVTFHILENVDTVNIVDSGDTDSDPVYETLDSHDDDDYDDKQSNSHAYTDWLNTSYCCDQSLHTGQ